MAQRLLSKCQDVKQEKLWQLIFQQGTLFGLKLAFDRVEGQELPLRINVDDFSINNETLTQRAELAAQGSFHLPMFAVLRLKVSTEHFDLLSVIVDLASLTIIFEVS